MEFIWNFLCTFSSSTNSNTNQNFHYSQRHMMESVFMALHFYDFVDLIFIKFFTYLRCNSLKTLRPHRPIQTVNVKQSNGIEL